MENLPINIFITIAIYLQPEDIINALSTCKAVKKQDCKLLWFTWLKEHAKYNPLVWNNPFFSRPITDNISLWRLKTTARLFVRFENIPAEDHIMNLIREDEHLLNNELLKRQGLILDKDRNEYSRYIISLQFPSYEIANILNCKVSEVHLREYIHSQFGHYLSLPSYVNAVANDNIKHFEFLKNISEYIYNNELPFESIVGLPANYYISTENETNCLRPTPVGGPPFTLRFLLTDLKPSYPTVEITKSDVKSDSDEDFKDYQIYTSFDYFDIFDSNQDIHKLDDPNMPIYDANECLNEYFTEILKLED